MKKAVSFLIFVAVLSMILVSFVACNGLSNNGATEKIYTCTTLENGAEITYSLRVNGKNATILRYAFGSTETYEGRLQLVSGSIYNFTVSEENDTIPDVLKNAKIELNAKENTFAFFNETDKNPPSGDTPNDDTDNNTPSVPDTPDTPDTPTVPDTPTTPSDPNTPPTSGDTDGSNGVEDEDDTPTIVVCTHSDFMIVDALAPTCTEEGNSGYKKCKFCGNKLSDSSPLSSLGHNFGDDKKCTRCDKYDVFGTFVNTSSSQSGDLAELLYTESTVLTLTLNQDHTFALNKEITATTTRPVAINGTYSEDYDDVHVFTVNGMGSEPFISSPTSNGYVYSYDSTNAIHSFIKITNETNSVTTETITADGENFAYATCYYEVKVVTTSSLSGDFTDSGKVVTLDTQDKCTLDFTTNVFSVKRGDEITVTYVVGNNVFTDTVLKNSQYVIGKDLAQSKWFTLADVYTKSQIVALEEDVTLYSVKYTVHYYDGESKTVTKLGTLPDFTFSEMNGYAFEGTFIRNEKVDETSYPTVGDVVIYGVYSKISKKPTLETNGEIEKKILTASGITTDTVEFPRLNETDYAKRVVTQPSLITKGQDEYYNADYGTYLVETSSLTVQTVVSDGVTYVINLENETVTIDGATYDADITANEDNISFEITKTQSTEESVNYYATITPFGSFTVDTNKITTAVPPSVGTYFGYKNLGYTFRIIDGTEVYAIQNQDGIISDYGFDFYPEEPTYSDSLNLYTQGNLYFTFINGVIVYSTTPDNLTPCANNGSLQFGEYDAYKATSDKLIIKSDDTYVLTHEGHTSNGTVDYTLATGELKLVTPSTPSQTTVAYLYTLDESGIPQVTKE